MKTYLLTAILTFSKPDTIPYLQHPYYSEDTLTTNKELRIENYRKTRKLKQAEKHSGTSIVLGFLFGVFITTGIFISVRP